MGENRSAKLGKAGYFNYQRERRWGIRKRKPPTKGGSLFDDLSQGGEEEN